MNQPTPAWFKSAVATPSTRHSVDVEGCTIQCQAWGEQSKPGLLLVHGNGAHMHWWDFIAPFFADDYYVVAYDLSGMGDSEHRAKYTAMSYANEVAAVSEAVGFTDKPVLIGHSFGARVIFKALQVYPQYFAGIIMADAPFSPPEHKFDFHKRRQQPVKPHRMYASLAEAKERFRLFPAQPCDNDYIIDYIGEHSIKQTSDGWCWKFDPKIYSTFDYEGLLSTQPTVEDNILAMVYGEYSTLYPEKMRQYNEQLFKQLELPELIQLPDAHHHLLLDQPLAFVEVLKDVLQQHSFR